MPLLTLQGVDYSVGGPLLLENVVLSLEAGERVALIGRNGAGKSTLLKLISGELKPDDGEVRVEGGVRIARLEQEVPAGAHGDVFDVVAEGMGELGAWLAQFHHLSHAEPVDTDAMAEVQARIEAVHGWGAEQRVAETLQRLSLQAARCWMIGDRHMDIEGARHHGMRNVGVLWGFGGREELHAAGADMLAETPQELQGFLSA